jgi:hypothetical protein
MSEKQKSMTVRLDAQTEAKFGIIWNILQQNEPPQIRLSRNDVFNIMVRDYHRSLTGRNNPFLIVHDSKRELE